MGLKILTFTSLYPDSTRPGYGIFVENRLRHLLAGGEVESRVVAPVPWFPSTGRIFGKYAAYARVPGHEFRYGIDVLHPRYPLFPKFGMTAAPVLMALAVKRTVQRIAAGGYHFDLIDAHYFYPDGVAAVILGRILEKPVVITARGTDLNLVPKYFFARRMIQWAAANADSLVAVCKALKDVLVQLGIPERKISVLRNGVDLSLFRPPRDRESLRQELRLREPTILSVGYLIRRKRHDMVIRALKKLPGYMLLIAGEGPEKNNLSSLADSLGLSDRVRFLGNIQHDRLADYYGTADVTVLASEREGWANVLLESLACGTPVIGTRVWGTPEVITAPEAGLLIDEGTPENVCFALRSLFANYPDRVKTRRYAEKFSWDDTTRGQIRIFEKVLNISSMSKTSDYSHNEPLNYGG